MPLRSIGLPQEPQEPNFNDVNNNVIAKVTENDTRTLLGKPPNMVGAQLPERILAVHATYLGLCPFPHQCQ